MTKSIFVMTSCSQFVHVFELGWGASLRSIFGKHARERYAPIYVSLVVLVKMLLKLSSKHESKKILLLNQKLFTLCNELKKLFRPLRKSEFLFLSRNSSACCKKTNMLSNPQIFNHNMANEVPTLWSIDVLLITPIII